MPPRCCLWEPTAALPAAFLCDQSWAPVVLRGCVVPTCPIAVQGGLPSCPIATPGGLPTCPIAVLGGSAILPYRHNLEVSPLRCTLRALPWGHAVLGLCWHPSACVLTHRVSPRRR